ncbi:aldehyde dehydrogenase [Fusarium agapanthi]|uniref:aldehyde dehydrogenase (NAD(+)) n=1 Tax=Fusarium agapanthi TaxID=1803897 RepID=A0A9P5E820_9HYPO|nr:aldehyde dehydrogenase [Fusarium agapanthi]
MAKNRTYCLFQFSTKDEIIELANDSKYGLASAVFVQDIENAIRVGDALETGQAIINLWGTVNANAAFGVIKESVFGRDLGNESIDESTEIKYVQVMVPKP